MNRPSYGGGSGHHGNYHSSQNQSYTQPAYSTPSSYGSNKSIGSEPRLFQPNHQSSPKTPSPQAVQQQPPSSQPPPPQQLQPSQQQPAPQVQQQQQPQPQQQLPPPVPPKIEPQSSIPAEPAPVKMDEDKSNETMSDANDDGMGSGTPGTRGPKFRPWNKRGAANIKITRKMRKRRQNARLRNLLAPKNAMMVLHELHPELKMVISEQVNAANQTAYTVEIEVEGKIYRGHGMSKMSAKQAASENALKAVLLEKLEQNNLKINPDNTLSSDGTQEGSIDVTMKEESVAGDVTNPEEQAAGPKPVQGRRLIEDDVPWGSLASFALFKLFSEWQSQGFQLPPSGLPPVFHKATGAKKLPDDANKKHPVQLLNQIRPGSQYSESREGAPPNLTFKFTVSVDGQTFMGVGSNKKDAKKECAKHALEADRKSVV